MKIFGKNSLCELRYHAALPSERTIGELFKVSRMTPRRALMAVEAELLGLTTYHAGIELEQTTYDQDGRPYCYDRQIWRGELAEFSSLTVVRDVKK